MLLFAAASTVDAQGPARHPKLDGLDPVISELRAEGRFPGVAVAVLRDGELVHAGTYGMASLEHGVPVTSATVFELASLSKAMTALAVITLSNEGKLSLDDRLAEYVADVPEAWSSITISQLLSHTAGLAHRFEPTVDGTLLTDYSTAGMLASAKATPMASQPGTDWEYSDQGYFLLGIVIEKVTGKSYAEHMQETYFDPLGMAQTRLLDQSAIVPHRAEGYAWEDGRLQRNRRVWQFGLASHFGITSSLDDMIAWERALNDPRAIDAHALEATGAIQREFDHGAKCDRWGYARGWTTHVVEGRRILTHGGRSGTAYLRAVDDGVSVIVLTNRQDTEDAISPMAIAWAAANAAEPTIPETGLSCWE